MRDKLLDRKIFYSRKKTLFQIEMWSHHYNKVRPHSTPSYKHPIPSTAAIQPSQITQVSLTL
ncbi:MAG: integrase core domain-containing protein [Anaerolineales bacterium]